MPSQNHVAVVLIIGLIGVLLQINATIVGWAFTVMDLPTTLLSNHTIGAGAGFGSQQSNPPGPWPAAIGSAYNVYSSWSYGMSEEPHPELREYILDRLNVSPTGNFSVNAVKAHRKMNCSSVPIEIAKDISDNWETDYMSETYMVPTKLTEDVELRFQSQLTLWVDDYWIVSATRAVTRLMFAIINGTIENGHHNDLKANIDGLCKGYCSGISSLACDVDIDLIASQACAGECTKTNATLSSLETIQPPGVAAFSPEPRYLWPISVWLGAVPTVFGTATYGAQPMFGPGSIVQNSSFVLPQSYRDWSYNDTQHWTQTNLTNFIKVTSGALGMMQPTAWQLNTTGNVTVASTLAMPRLNTDRSYSLLAPPGIALASVAMLEVLSMLMYRSANVLETRLGSASEIAICTQMDDVKAVVEDIRVGLRPKTVLGQMRLRYETVADGHHGLGGEGNVRSFPLR